MLRRRWLSRTGWRRIGRRSLAGVGLVCGGSVSWLGPVQWTRPPEWWLEVGKGTEWQGVGWGGQGCGVGIVMGGSCGA